MSLLVENLHRTANGRPEWAAFRCGSEELSYGQLVEHSNRLAAALRARGVGPGDRVGILQGKGIDNPVAVYGIMTAGAAYVPLDPAAPVARLASIVADGAIDHLVSDEERMAKAVKVAAASGRAITIYGVDRSAGVDALASSAAHSDAGPIELVSRAEVAAQDPSSGTLPADPDDPAYIIFTSGSTGAPKGIVHTHRSGSAYATMAAELYGLTGDDRLSNFPPLHFDQSTFDFFSGPLVGATTVIIGKEHQLVPASLAQLIEDERLTIWYSVPLALVQLLLYGVLHERDHSSLRWVIYGGEPFPLKHLRALMDRWPEARFSNCYGPAETNQCTYHHLEPLTDDDVASGAGVPIGAACPGTEVVVVDGADRPVPSGEQGQLLVTSPTTMQGYLGRADLDHRAFHHTDGPDGRTRWYRTGDLVRHRADGALEFLGRADRQIKTRGVRVELDEVEAVLSNHDAVEEAAVAPVPDEDGVAVAAWVSVRSGHDLDPAGLRRHAARHLARPAVPATIAVVEDFPRTTSGKIDYRALTDTSRPDLAVNGS